MGISSLLNFIKTHQVILEKKLKMWKFCFAFLESLWHIKLLTEVHNVIYHESMDQCFALFVFVFIKEDSTFEENLPFPDQKSSTFSGIMITLYMLTVNAWHKHGLISKKCITMCSDMNSKHLKHRLIYRNNTSLIHITFKVDMRFFFLSVYIVTQIHVVKNALKFTFALIYSLVR